MRFYDRFSLTKLISTNGTNHPEVNLLGCFVGIWIDHCKFVKKYDLSFNGPKMCFGLRIYKCPVEQTIFNYKFMLRFCFFFSCSHDLFILNFQFSNNFWRKYQLIYVGNSISLPYRELKVYNHCKPQFFKVRQMLTSH